MVSALVLLFREGDGCVLGRLGTGRRWEEVDGVLLELVRVELAPKTLALTLRPEARPRDLLTVFSPERVLCPALFSRSCGKVPLPRLLNAARSRSLPFPYFNNEKTRPAISIS